MMTDQIKALDALIEAVEAGNYREDLFCPLFHKDGLCMDAENAYSGSVDAALALKDALLPGWRWTVGGRVACVFRDGQEMNNIYAPSNGIPARALLIATLKAYRHELEGRG